MTLDDRIYCLQRSPLTRELCNDLVTAHALYLKERDAEAERIVLSIERRCAEQNIEIFIPKFAFAF